MIPDTKRRGQEAWGGETGGGAREGGGGGREGRGEGGGGGGVGGGGGQLLLLHNKLASYGKDCVCAMQMYPVSKELSFSQNSTNLQPVQAY